MKILIRKIKDPVSSLINKPTPRGKTGILVNGVEILNYKSADTVFFGPIERVNILNSGTDYDAQNPPNIVITDENDFRLNLAIKLILTTT